MTPVAVIGALATGDPTAANWLLPACRAHAYGVEAFGPAAIGALFARNPASLSRTPDMVAAARGIALFDADANGCEQAWFADLCAGGIARLWRLGPGLRDAPETEPSFAYAADAFLDQQRQTLAFRAADHPELAPEAVGPLRDTAAAVAAGGDPAGQPCRIAVLRALSAGDRTAALLARLGGTGNVPCLGSLALRHAGGRALHSRLTWDAIGEP